ncbi:MAG: hypothetical protein PHO15_05815 [Eubacteriales bacterium]|nr:hypothetical protein [Eubacteriales bacterium]
MKERQTESITGVNAVYATLHLQTGLGVGQKPMLRGIGAPLVSCDAKSAQKKKPQIALYGMEICKMVQVQDDIFAAQHLMAILGVQKDIKRRNHNEIQHRRPCRS